jgi:hypothetical protein
LLGARGKGLFANGSDGIPEATGGERRQGPREEVERSSAKGHRAESRRRKREGAEREGEEEGEVEEVIQMAEVSPETARTYRLAGVGLAFYSSAGLFALGGFVFPRLSALKLNVISDGQFWFALVMSFVFAISGLSLAELIKPHGSIRYPPLAFAIDIFECFVIALAFSYLTPTSPPHAPVHWVSYLLLAPIILLDQGWRHFTGFGTNESLLYVAALWLLLCLYGVWRPVAFEYFDIGISVGLAVLLWIYEIVRPPAPERK